MYKNPRYQSGKRREIERILTAAGLQAIAGGERFTYYGLPSHDPKVGIMVRVGAKAFRLVRRARGIGKIVERPVGPENYHGKVSAAKVAAWAAHLSATDMGQRKEPGPATPTPTAPPTSVPSLDIAIADEGSIVLFYGRTDAGRDWLAGNLHEPMRFGDAYAVEHRFAPDIAAGAAGAGLKVGGNG